MRETVVPDVQPPDRRSVNATRAVVVKIVAANQDVLVDTHRVLRRTDVMARLDDERAKIRSRREGSATRERAVSDYDVLCWANLVPSQDVRRDEEPGKQVAAEAAILDPHVL